MCFAISQKPDTASYLTRIFRRKKTQFWSIFAISLDVHPPTMCGRVETGPKPVLLGFGPSFRYSIERSQGYNFVEIKILMIWQKPVLIIQKLLTLNPSTLNTSYRLTIEAIPVNSKISKSQNRHIMQIPIDDFCSQFRCWRCSWFFIRYWIVRACIIEIGEFFILFSRIQSEQSKWDHSAKAGDVQV